jgi:hypothetical protein
VQVERFLGVGAPEMPEVLKHGWLPDSDDDDVATNGPSQEDGDTSGLGQGDSPGWRRRPKSDGDAGLEMPGELSVATWQADGPTRKANDKHKTKDRSIKTEDRSIKHRKHPHKHKHKHNQRSALTDDEESKRDGGAEALCHHPDLLRLHIQDLEVLPPHLPFPCELDPPSPFWARDCTGVNCLPCAVCVRVLNASVCLSCANSSRPKTAPYRPPSWPSSIRSVCHSVSLSLCLSVSLSCLFWGWMDDCVGYAP